MTSPFPERNRLETKVFAIKEPAIAANEKPRVNPSAATRGEAVSFGRYPDSALGGNPHLLHSRPELSSGFGLSPLALSESLARKFFPPRPEQRIQEVVANYVDQKRDPDSVPCRQAGRKAGRSHPIAARLGRSATMSIRNEEHSQQLFPYSFQVAAEPPPRVWNGDATSVLFRHFQRLLPNEYSPGTGESTEPAKRKRKSAKKKKRRKRDPEENVETRRRAIEADLPTSLSNKWDFPLTK